MWGRGQSACRFVLCFRKNWGERYAAASVKPCKNCPPDSVPAPQKSLHSVNLPQTEASLSLSSAVFPIRRPQYYSTVSTLRFSQVLRMQNLPRSATALSLSSAVFPVRRPPYYSTVSKLRFSPSFANAKFTAFGNCVKSFKLSFPPSMAHAKLAADGNSAKSFKRSFSRPPLL